MEKLDRVLDRTFQATTDRSFWEGILVDMADAMDAVGANIIPANERTHGSIIYTPSLARGFEEYFDEGWQNNDWHLNSLPFLSRYGVARDLQYTSRDVFERHDFYRFIRKHGLGHTILAAWHMSPQDGLVLAIHRKAGESPFTQEEESVLQGVRNRLQDAGRLMRHVASSRMSGMAEGLDMTGTPAIFFDRFHKVTHVNQGAQALLGPDLQISGREIHARRGDDTRRIRQRMHAVTTQRLSGLRELQGLVVLEREGQSPILLRIQRIGGYLPDIFTAAAGVCLVEGAVPRPAMEGGLLRARFGLTAQETAILLHLRDGLSVREIAEKSARSYETVRTQVKAIFQKTGTRRQGELLALIDRLRSPVGP